MSWGGGGGKDCHIHSLSAISIPSLPSLCNPSLPGLFSFSFSIITPSPCPRFPPSDLQTGIGHLPANLQLSPTLTLTIFSQKCSLRACYLQIHFWNSPLNSSQLSPVTSAASLGLQLHLQGHIQKPLYTPPP